LLALLGAHHLLHVSRIRVKAVLVLANCVGRTEKGARNIRNIVTLTLTNKKWNYFMIEAGLVKPLDL
jgi:hypothetical protein